MNSFFVIVDLIPLHDSLRAADFKRESDDLLHHKENAVTKNLSVIIKFKD